MLESIFVTTTAYSLSCTADVMGKKRKETTQASTLDHFFSKGATPTSNKKAKLRTTPTPAKSAASKPFTKPTFGVSSDEIIVLDSDDEQEHLVIDDSSDIEVLEDGPSVALAASGSKLNCNETRAPRAHPGHISMDEIADVVFGEPSLLIEARSSRPKPEHEGEDTDFGLPSLLNDTESFSTYKFTQDNVVPSAYNETDRPSRPSPYPLQKNDSIEEIGREGTSYMQHDSIDREPSEQFWELGDDEAAVEGPDTIQDVDEPAIEEDLQDSIEDAVQTCPMCNIRLDNMSHLVSLSVVFAY